MIIGVLIFELFLPGCHSLKEKRGFIKPVVVKLQREFNLSVAEVDEQDKWQKAVIACCMVGSDRDHVHSSLEHVVTFFERSWTEIIILKSSITFL